MAWLYAQNQPNRCWERRQLPAARAWLGGVGRGPRVHVFQAGAVTGDGRALCVLGLRRLVFLRECDPAADAGTMGLCMPQAARVPAPGRWREDVSPENRHPESG